MDYLEIKKYPDPVLRQKCEEIKEITNEIRNLAKKMLKTMRQRNGIGLAASQVGKQKRLITVDIGQGSFSFVNPQIINRSGKTSRDYEGCLSLPGIALKIKRAKEIEVSGYLLEKEKSINLKVEGLLARVLQHEIDHLDGILIIDRVSYFQKLRVIKDLKKAGLV